MLYSVIELCSGREVGKNLPLQAAYELRDGFQAAALAAGKDLNAERYAVRVQ